MTGVAWVDWAATAAFAAVAAVAVLLLGLRPVVGLAARADAVVHAVMALAMADMSLPGRDLVPAGAWIAVFVAAALWSTAVMAHRSWSHATDRPGRPGNSPRVGAAGHHLAACVVMVVAFGVGHGSHSPVVASGSPPSTGARTATHQHHHHGHSGGAHPQTDEAHPPIDRGSGLDAVAGWPVWPLVGTGFVIHGIRAAARDRREPLCRCSTTGPRLLLSSSTLERACTTVMSVGMGVMAYTL